MISRSLGTLGVTGGVGAISGKILGELTAIAKQNPGGGHISLEVALEQFQNPKKSISHHEVLRDRATERHRDAMCQFFEETGSTIQVDEQDKIAGISVAPEHEATWRQMFLETEEGKRIGDDLIGFVEARQLVGWKVSRPDEFRKFCRKNTDERKLLEKELEAGLQKRLHQIAAEYDGVDIEKSVAAVWNDRYDSVGTIEEKIRQGISEGKQYEAVLKVLRKLAAKEGIQDVPGGALVDLSMLRGLAKKALTDKKRKPTLYDGVMVLCASGDASTGIDRLAQKLKANSVDNTDVNAIVEIAAGPSPYLHSKFTAQIEEVMRSPEVRKNVLSRWREQLAAHGIHDVPEDGARTARAAVKTARALVEIAEEDRRAVEGEDHVKVDVEQAKRIARDLVWPPSLTSARNVEVATMAAMEFLIASGMMVNEGKGVVASKSWPPELTAALLGTKIQNRLASLFERMPDGNSEHQDDPTFEKLFEFGWHWRRSTFARLEVGHKLAANFALADMENAESKGVEIRAPWEAWSLVVPDGLLGDAARVWLIGTEPAFLVRTNGAVEHWPEAKLDRIDRDMLTALALSSCLALSNPDEFKREGVHSRSRSSGSKEHRGEPEQVRYLLSAPVEIDLRDVVRETREDRKGKRGGWKPKSQWLVRGHWRNQAWGPRHSLRRATWIRPARKGKVNGRVLLRGHKVDEKGSD